MKETINILLFSIILMAGLLLAGSDSPIMPVPNILGLGLMVMGGIGIGLNAKS